MTASVSNPTANPAAVLWTGGKDSALALHEARKGGWRVSCLVTFAPPEPDFLAHPIAIMKLQAEALGLPHYMVPVREPFAAGYEAGLTQLHEHLQVGTVITGDIAEVGGQPNWIRERCRPIGLNVLTPLWGRDRLTILRQLLAARFEVVFSCIKMPWLTPDWVGRTLDDQSVAELCDLRQKNGMDLCGEEGEYHTLIMDSPDFRRRMRLDALSVREQGVLAYLEVGHVELADKL